MQVLIFFILISVSHSLPDYTFSTYYEYYLHQIGSIHDHFDEIGYDISKLDFHNKQQLLQFHTICSNHFEQEPTNEYDDYSCYLIFMMIHRHRKAIHSLNL